MLSKEDQLLTRELSEYTWLVEKHSAKVRLLPYHDAEAIYNSVLEKGTAQFLVIPPKEDTEKRKEYFAFCDGLCKKEPTTPEECIKAVFAASAAAQAFLNDMLAEDISPERYGAIWKAVTANTFRELEKQKADINANTGAGAPALPTPAPSLPLPQVHPITFGTCHCFQPATDPLNRSEPGGHAPHPAELLLGKPFSYHDVSQFGKIEKIRRCTVEDYGTSYLRGRWFAVTHEDDENELMVSEREMDEILAQRVPVEHPKL